MTSRSIASRSEWAVVIVALVALAGAILWHARRRAEVTPAIRGMKIAQKLGCFACHGPEGTGGVATVGDASGFMPGWDHATTIMYLDSEQQLREWIWYGLPMDQATGANGPTSTGFIPMPAYEGELSADELDDLVAYYFAVSGWAPDIPDDAYEGWKISSKSGCFGCHGPSGMGGVANPGSFTGYIPPWDGEGFAELVLNDDELREWILRGRIERLWNNEFARYFLKAQKTQMPAYRDHASQDDVCKMVAYIKWLRER